MRLAALIALLSSPVHARTVAGADTGSLPPPEPLVLVGDALRTQALPLPESLREHLRNRRWEPAARDLLAFDPSGLAASGRADHAFLLAWCLVHADRGAEAVQYLPLLDGHTLAPETYVRLVRGEVYLATGAWLDAVTELQAVPETSVMYPRAAMQRAEALRELARTSEAEEIWTALIERPDPVDGNPQALLALGEHRGPGSDEAYPSLRRLWTHYAGTSEASTASTLLKAYAGRGAAFRPTPVETGLRAERLMVRGLFRSAIQEIQPTLAGLEPGSQAACRAHFVLGRSHYRQNELTHAVNAFADAGERCVEADGDYGPRSLYLKATSEFRRRRFTDSAATWDQLPALYPDHSMADDGLTRGGIALQEAGDLAAAQDRWRRALELYPDGDTVPEATWRLAFSLYLDGDAAGALDIAERLGELSLDLDPVHVAAGRYWAPRWRLFPDVDDPTQPVDDPEERALAIAAWEALVQDLPHSYYSVLAWSRLAELVPERAAELADRGDDHDRGDPGRPWVVRLSVHDDPALRDGVALARLGLLSEAEDAWSHLDREALTGDEIAWLVELRIAAGDWLDAHDTLRRWLQTHPPGTLGEREPQVLRVAFPDRYWDLVKHASHGDVYEPRLLHALVREESNFNRRIVSHAGARGLSQLMPATALQTAGWLGIEITMDDLDDPATNLKIGARYLDAMHRQLGDSPFLALAAYNAGAGRVNQWRGRWGNVPSDEYVERIPFRETRGYVKRVMETWQTMRWQFDDDQPGFPDLVVYNHAAFR